MEKYELVIKIKEEIPNFNEQELLDFTKTSIPVIYNYLINRKIDKAKIYCTEALTKKMLKNSSLYRVSNDIDNIRVESARLHGCVRKGGKFYIKVNASIFFYDNVDNNINTFEIYDKYWNDIWIVTLECKGDKKIMNQCPTCGAFMKFNSLKKMFKCEYCGNSVCYSPIEWKIVDIDVNKSNYFK